MQHTVEEVFVESLARVVPGAAAAQPVRWGTEKQSRDTGAHNVSGNGNVNTASREMQGGERCGSSR